MCKNFLQQLEIIPFWKIYIKRLIKENSIILNDQPTVPISKITEEKKKGFKLTTGMFSIK